MKPRGASRSSKSKLQDSKPDNDGHKKAASKSIKAAGEPLPNKLLNKPLVGKVFYLDLPCNKRTEALENDIIRLGGTVEKFFSKEIRYLVSGKQEARYVQRLCRDSPAASHDSSLSSPQPGSRRDAHAARGSSQGPADTVVVSRGKSLVEKVVKEQERMRVNRTLSNALEWGVKILHIDDIISYIDKKKMKLTQYSTATPAVKKNAKAGPPAEAAFQKAHAGRISRPFVKVEDSSRHYRPIYLPMPTLPACNYSSAPPCSPFYVEESAKDGPGRRHKPLRSGGERVRGRKGRHRGQEAREKRRGGYCECCVLKYDNLKAHLQGSQHQAFSQSDEYLVVDRLISALTCNFTHTATTRAKRAKVSVSSVLLAAGPAAMEGCSGGGERRKRERVAQETPPPEERLGAPEAVTPRPHHKRCREPLPRGREAGASAAERSQTQPASTGSCPTLQSAAERSQTQPASTGSCPTLQSAAERSQTQPASKGSCPTLQSAAERSQTQPASTGFCPALQSAAERSQTQPASTGSCPTLQSAAERSQTQPASMGSCFTLQSAAERSQTQPASTGSCPTLQSAAERSQTQPASTGSCCALQSAAERSQTQPASTGSCFALQSDAHASSISSTHATDPQHALSSDLTNHRLGGGEQANHRLGSDPTKHRLGGGEQANHRLGSDPTNHRLGGGEQANHRLGSDPTKHRLGGGEQANHRLGSDPTNHRLGGGEQANHRLGSDPTSYRLGREPVSQRLGSDPTNHRLGGDQTNQRTPCDGGSLHQEGRKGEKTVPVKIRRTIWSQPNRGSETQTSQRNRGAETQTSQRNRGAETQTSQRNRGAETQTSRQNKGPETQTSQQSRGAETQTSQQTRGAETQTSESETGCKPDAELGANSGTELGAKPVSDCKLFRCLSESGKNAQGNPVDITHHEPIRIERPLDVTHHKPIKTKNPLNLPGGEPMGACSPTPDRSLQRKVRSFRRKRKVSSQTPHTPHTHTPPAKRSARPSPPSPGSPSLSASGRGLWQLFQSSDSAEEFTGFQD